MIHAEIGDATLECSIDELVRQWPEVVAFFLSYQLDCVGCNFDRFHSLQTALQLYGINPDQFLEDLKEFSRTQSGG